MRDDARHCSPDMTRPYVQKGEHAQETCPVFFWMNGMCEG